MPKPGGGKGDVKGQKSRWRRSQRDRRDSDPEFGEEFRAKRREQKRRARERKRAEREGTPPPLAPLAPVQWLFTERGQHEAAALAEAGFPLTTAEGRGDCPFCGERIHVGQIIGKHPVAGWAHARCALSAPAPGI